MELSKQEFIEILDARFKANNIELKTELKTELKSEFKEMIVQTVKDEGKLIVDQMRSEIVASENRQDKKAEAMEKRIIESVSDAIGNGVVPQIEEHETRIVKLEQKLAV